MPKKAARNAVGFLSYVHFDDVNDQGWITTFRKRLSGEIRAQTGEPFEIFQDRKDVKWGQNWRNRIEEAVDSSSFFFLILTPSYLKSRECRAELRRFLSFESRIKRNDLLYAVHYISCDRELANTRTAYVKKLKVHQMADWRELRFEDFNDRTVRKELARMAIHVRDAVDITR